MADFRRRLMRFLMGRYAQIDALYRAQMAGSLTVLIAGSVMSAIGASTRLLGFRIAGLALYILAVGLLAWAICRFLSKKINVRQRENDAWLKLRRRLNPFCKRATNQADTETHVFRSCPACGALLRLPRKAGKHTVRCPRCAKKFTVRIK